MFLQIILFLLYVISCINLGILVINEEIYIAISLILFYIIFVLINKANINKFFYNEARFIYLIFYILFCINTSIIFNIGTGFQFFGKYIKLFFEKEYFHSSEFLFLYVETNKKIKRYIINLFCYMLITITWSYFMYTNSYVHNCDLEELYWEYSLYVAKNAENDEIKNFFLNYAC